MIPEEIKKKRLENIKPKSHKKGYQIKRSKNKMPSEMSLSLKEIEKEKPEEIQNDINLINDLQNELHKIDDKNDHTETEKKCRWIIPKGHYLKLFVKFSSTTITETLDFFTFENYNTIFNTFHKGFQFKSKSKIFF